MDTVLLIAASVVTGCLLVFFVLRSSVKNKNQQGTAARRKDGGGRVRSPGSKKERNASSAAFKGRKRSAGRESTQTAEEDAQPAKEKPVQVRKRRVASGNAEVKEEKQLFSFPDNNFTSRDPLMSDRVSAARLDDLINQKFEGIDDRFDAKVEEDKNSGGPSEIMFSCGKAGTLQDEAVEKGSGAQAAAQEQADAGEEPETEEETSDIGNVPSSGRDGKEPAAVFKNLVFKQRENTADFVSRIKPAYSLEYAGSSAKMVIFSGSVKMPKQDGHGNMELYNCHVYDGMKPKKWDDIFEVRVRRGQKVHVDLGVGVLLPEGYALQLTESQELGKKFGLQLVSSTIICREEAADSIIIDLVGCTDISYVSKNQSLVKCRVVRVA